MIDAKHELPKGVWIEHTPGKCPVPEDTMVKVRSHSIWCDGFYPAREICWEDSALRVVTHYMIQPECVATSHMVDPPDQLTRLRAQNAALVEALKECADLAWSVDTREVVFDDTVVFGKGYDFEGLDLREEIFCAEGWFMVWPSATKWYAYGGSDGTFWTSGFDNKADAKSAVIRHIAIRFPNHPAVKASAALAQAESDQ
jgi:hypothetical protein